MNQAQKAFVVTVLVGAMGGAIAGAAQYFTRYDLSVADWAKKKL